MTTRVLILWASESSLPVVTFVADVTEEDLVHLRDCNYQAEDSAEEESWQYVAHRIGKARKYKTEKEFEIEKESLFMIPEAPLEWSQYGIWKEGKPGETGGASLFFVLYAQYWGFELGE